MENIVNLVRNRVLRYALLLSVLLVAWSVPAQQKTQDQAGIARFVNSVAGTIYKLAWPTATYREVSLDSIRLAPGGFDVAVKLSGQSGIDDSDLWVRLVILIRNGTIADINVVDDNAIVSPPFRTTTTMANLALQLGQQYSAAHATTARAPAAASPATTTPSVAAAGAPFGAPVGAAPGDVQQARAACLVNDTQNDISFQYRWGSSPWKAVTLGANKQLTVWWPDDVGGAPAGQLSMRYDEDFTPGYQERDYDLDVTETSLPVACSAVPAYNFSLNGSKILLFTAQRSDGSR